MAIGLLMAAVAGRFYLGIPEGRCRPNEPGPALLITAHGLKDRQGVLQAELYPDNDDDFLADDKVLIREGKTFRRAVTPLPANGPAQLCMRVPAPGTYTLSLLHDRDGNRKFSVLSDGIGFAGNPHVGRSKPAASTARVTAGPGVTPVSILLNYYHGLFSFGPLKRPEQ